MKQTAYSGGESVVGEIIRTAERSALKHEGENGLRTRLTRLVKRYEKEFRGKTAFLAASAAVERKRLNERLDVLMLKNAPDEWMARLWHEMHALDIAAQLLMGGREDYVGIA